MTVSLEHPSLSPVPEPGDDLGRPGWSGIKAMAAHEFRLRIRAGRWKWLLTAWVLLLAVFTGLLQAAFGQYDIDRPGGFMFGALMMFVLGLALLVVPALTAQSVNGDRERGVLATLQITLLTPTEIAVGKLLAGWATALVFLATSLPMVVWCMALGGVPVTRALVSLAVTALLLGVICAIALCLSALLARSTTSAVLSYLAVFVLAVGTLIAFGLGVALTTTQVTRTETWPTPTGTEQTETYVVSEQHPERVWWLLAPNPFVIVADASPSSRDAGIDHAIAPDDDPLRSIGDAVRQARDPDAWDYAHGTAIHRGGQKPVWPIGLAFDVTLAAGALALTIRRLRTPYRTLPRSVRVA